MQKAVFIFLLFIATKTQLFAQLNFVPNPDFEDTLECPYFVSQIDYANHWVTTKFTPDYFHSCNNNSPVNTGWVGVPVNARGFQPARSGEAYAGIVSYYEAQADYREAFSAQLTQPLVAGETYLVGMWLVLMEDYARWAIDGGIGIYLSNGPIDPTLYFTYTPQIMNPPGNVLNDSLNWTLISGNYTAAGGENYITIGGFLRDSMLTFFDRGSGSGYNFTTYAIEDVFVIPPLGTTIPDHADALNISIYPNPCSSSLNVSLNMVDIDKTRIELFNILGEKIYSCSINDSGTIIPVEQFSPGVYSIHVLAGNKVFDQRVIIQ
jgi:hypothetical protein